MNRRTARQATLPEPQPVRADPIADVRERLRRRRRCGQLIERVGRLIGGDDGRPVYHLPPYQRPAVWSAEQGAVLLSRLMRGYPGGSLLLWERPDGSVYVIDGQQRLTTLGADIRRGDGTANASPVLYLDLDAYAHAPDDAVIWHPEPRGDVSPTVANLLSYDYQYGLWGWTDTRTFHLFGEAARNMQDAEFHIIRAGGWTGRVTPEEVRQLFIMTNTGGSPMSAETVAALVAGELTL